MIPTAPFTPVGVTMSQCPIIILDCRLNSRIPLFHWLLTPTGVIGAVGIIFDILGQTIRETFKFYPEDCGSQFVTHNLWLS